MKRLCVVDGQGGGIGAAIIRAVKSRYGESIEIWALGTNAVATAQMLRAGANRGATGENPVVRAMGLIDAVLGPVAITWPHAMVGEVTPRMAEAISLSAAPKILIPLHHESVVLIGSSMEPLPHLIDMMLNKNLMEVLRNV